MQKLKLLHQIVAELIWSYKIKIIFLFYQWEQFSHKNVRMFLLFLKANVRKLISSNRSLVKMRHISKSFINPLVKRRVVRECVVTG